MSITTKQFLQWTICDGRAVKALDLKSIGIFPREFKSSRRYNTYGDSILIIQHDAHVIDFVNLLVPVLGHNFLNFYSILKIFS